MERRGVWDVVVVGGANAYDLARGPKLPTRGTGAPGTVCITGGVFQDFAPSPYQMHDVLAPFLERMGCAQRYG